MKVVRLGLIAGLASVLAGSFVGSPSVQADTSTTVSRLAGDDRFGTAVAIAQHQFPLGSDEVFVARGREPIVDALAGGSLTGGPILLVGPDCAPPHPVVLEEVSRLAPERVTALGGTAAVCDEQIRMLARSAGAAVATDRLAGEDRYETAVAIARRQFPGTASSVYLARGVDPIVDALAGGILSDGPILLIPGDCASVPSAVLSEVARLQPSTVVALGGENAICHKQLESAARAGSAEQRRLAGPTRYETAAEIARQVFPGRADTVYLARGVAPIVDALAGGTLTGGPILLVPPDCAALPDRVRFEIARMQPRRVIGLGGTAAICTPQLEEARAIVGRGADTAMCSHELLPGLTHLTRPQGVVASPDRFYALDNVERNETLDGHTLADVFEEVEIFDHAGNHLAHVGGSAITKGLYAAASGDRFVVVDDTTPPDFPSDELPEGDAVRLFSKHGELLRTIPVNGPLTFTEPSFANNRLYLMDLGRSFDDDSDDELRVYTRDGALAGVIPIGETTMNPDLRQRHGYVYLRSSQPAFVQILNRDGVVLRTLEGYRDVRLDSDRIYLTKGTPSGSGQIDVYSVDGTTLLGSTGVLEGYPVVAAAHPDRVYVTINDRGLVAMTEDGQLLGPPMIDQEALGAGGHLTYLWTTAERLYAETTVNDDSGPTYVFDRSGVRRGTIDGRQLYWFRPTNDVVYVTDRSFRGFVLDRDGTVVRGLSNSSGIDGIFPAVAPDAAQAPRSRSGNSNWLGGPRGWVLRPDSAIPGPPHLYVRDRSSTGWQLDIYTPAGAYIETVPDTNDVTYYDMGAAILLIDWQGRDADPLVSVWRQTGASC